MPRACTGSRLHYQNIKTKKNLTEAKCDLKAVFSYVIYKMAKYICVHGHFYQPPRENPWLEAVELQDSASPFHDWNERITSECYGPNSRARVLDEKGKIIDLFNNYARLSFNFGPTLLRWLHETHPEIHQQIVEADKVSSKSFSGHGSAIAQVYNHMIMPLSNYRDKHTQVIWGIRDFESRFSRFPEGMWLPETAADTESLEVLAEFGIKFTILSPYQASQVRALGTKDWIDVNGGKIDPHRPYFFKLPSGKQIALFFYDGPLSRAVAFEKLPSNGALMAERMYASFDPNAKEDQLVHIATDGESYGHHLRYGDMALAWALGAHTQQDVKITNYGEYLATHEPQYEVKIHEKSAWSCSHGVGRWCSDCGCNSGGYPGWNQAWRAPLRKALDWLRDITAPLYETQASRLFKNPWEARDEYISVILDRSTKSVDAFFNSQALRPLQPQERIEALKLLELERHAMLMYTSCGWYFDELSGIETVQVIQYAGRVIQLSKEIFNIDLESQCLEHLSQAKSNIPEHGDGAIIYNKWVKPAMIGWKEATAHYAIGSIFNSRESTKKVFVFTFDDGEVETLSAGKIRLVIGNTLASSQITEEKAKAAFAVLYMGEHNVTAGIREYIAPEDFRHMAEDLKSSFDEVDIAKMIGGINRHFGESCYSLNSLFKDEQRKVLHELLATTREDLESRFRRIADRYVPLLKFLGPAGKSLLPALETVAIYVLRANLERQFASEIPDLDQLKKLLEETRVKEGHFMDAEMSYAVNERMACLMGTISETKPDLSKITFVRQFAELVIPLPLDLNLWKVQNMYWEMLRWRAPQFKPKALAGDKDAMDWLREFLQVGRILGFAVDGFFATPAS